ncbi:RagB/SusD family nutrient uptake outer membrane protein [Chitinophaga sp. XS-30]|uniref:RagB/SusD family nutrient uptake outer membrane protein n=1 Tax=Chitinophaga sp. XS-30 TaxID=2604421 RepID=UPI0011DDC451|nr:RagB/SusD family nutrient uptake outer membrane protein [Chitinophaga sp. XS-30]QEH43296.1 RagB/SusD family nutrient uptake outer membrane protein [Chitinophaga sp. XS-30]
MKRIIRFNIYIALILGIVLTSGCSKYLDIVPKGRKMPTTLADFEALMRDEYGNHRYPHLQAIYLLNDRFERAEALNYYPLNKANYMWSEGENRVTYNNSDESAYYTAYAAISSYNLLVQYAPEATEATDAERKVLIAQAKLGRAMHYFLLVNYYADTYDASSAGTKLSVPLIESADIGAPYQQVTIQEMYDYIIRNASEALPDLPVKGATILHGSKGAAHAFLARVYLQMGDYDKALTSANEALAQNDKLFDWVAFYNSYQTQIDQPGVYPSLPSPRTYDFEENYIFGHEDATYSKREYNIRTDRAARFEAGDASFMSRWKLRTIGTDTYYYSIMTGRFNDGGITTSEVYLIKAECLAREDDWSGAMQALNAVRIKRILPAQYTALTAASTAEAIEYIRRTKESITLFSIVAFADMRRFNKEPQYARTLAKTENGTALTLAPGSHMWTMPFPQGAINNPGNGTIHQNVNQ